MQDLDDHVLGIIADRAMIFWCSVKIEPVFKVIHIRENFRHDEIEQAPQLSDVVLQGRPSQQESSLTLNFSRNYDCLTLVILELVGFIEGNKVPIENWPTKLGYVLKSGVMRHTNIKLPRYHFFFQNPLSVTHRGYQINDSELGSPTSELFHPVWNRGLRSND